MSTVAAAEMSKRTAAQSLLQAAPVRVTRSRTRSNAAQNRPPRVLGLVGCSSSGKSTLCDALQRECLLRQIDLRVVVCDAHFKPKADCPTFDIDALPWPAATPAAFRARGNADLNVPSSVDWRGVLAELSQAASSNSHVVVEGCHLLGDHPDAQAVRDLCDNFVLLETDDTKAEVLMHRKYTRAHLGNTVHVSLYACCSACYLL